MDTGVIPKSLPLLSTEPVLCKALSTEDYGFRPSSTDGDRPMTLLNALKMRNFNVCFYLFGFKPFLK